jgi:hypothetical protein
MWRGTVHSRMLRGVPYKGEIQWDDKGEGLKCAYNQVDKKGMYIEYHYI